MGITAGPTYISEHGFAISPLYLSINNMRLSLTSGGDFQCVFTVQGFKSHADKKAGRQPISLPQHLSLIDTFTNPTVFSTGNIFDFAYKTIKARWGSSGYEVNDLYDYGQDGYVPPSLPSVVVVPALTVTVPGPVVPVPEPVVEVPETSVEVAEPSVTVPEPVVEVAEPSVTVSEPVVEVPEPTVEVPEPVVEVPEPTEAPVSENI